MVEGRIDAVRAARAREDRAFTGMIGAPANMEAITAFLEKREPDFSESRDRHVALTAMTIAATRSGKIEGVEHDGVHVFRGIPYAAPPVGPLRWQPPRREEAWDGVRDATRFSPTVGADRPPDGDACSASNSADYSEDSLYLNVWTPACDDARRPVMVWIHGGAFVFGSGDTPWYDGTNFAQHGDVVVVTINYRLGPFGFLHLADLFGPTRSPARATRASSTRSPRSNGCATASPRSAATPTTSRSSASRPARPASAHCSALPPHAGCSTGRSRRAAPAPGSPPASAPRRSPRERSTTSAYGPTDLAALQALPVADLFAAQPDLGDEDDAGSAALTCQPVVDGDVLADRTARRDRRGQRGRRARAHRHESARDDAVPDPRPGAWRLSTTTGSSLGCGRPRERPGVAPARVPRRDARRDVGTRLWSALATDGVFRIPAIRLLEAQGSHGRSWLYLFTCETPVFGGILRSTHALEIPFVFDNLDQRGADMLTGDGPERQAIADAMHRAWIAFARTGDPGWPAYEAPRRATMRFDRESELVDDPERPQREAWES